MNGTQRRLALLLGAGFLLITFAITLANAESMITDFASAGVPVTNTHVWIWETTSITAWLAATPVIWWMVARLRRSGLPWWAITLIVAAATVPASAWHIGGMVLLRRAIYALRGEHYDFMVGVQNPILYEYRKDIATFLQFGAVATIAQWLIARAATVADTRRTLAVNDGAVTHRVPLDEIDWIASAANYVEIAWGQRRLLNRKTLASMEEELGDTFVRIHRTRLVRRAAIRRIETDRSGDFAVTLASGEQLRGSRRYRDGV